MLHVTRTSDHRSSSVARWSALVIAASAASSAGAATWKYHLQRVHDPAGVGAQSVAIEPQPGGGYIYAANHVSPFLPPPAQNMRPTFIRTDANLKAQTSFTYARPNEWNTLYSTQLYLSATDMKTAADGGFIVCGDYEEAGASAGAGAFLLKVDATLNVQWFRQYPATYLPGPWVSRLAFRAVVPMGTAGGPETYVVAGMVADANLEQAFVGAFGANGAPLWGREIRGLETHDESFNWGWATDIIAYDADSVAITGYVNGGPHNHCQNFFAHGDVLVARLGLDGTIEFVGAYGQSETGSDGAFSFAERGNSLVRPIGSTDLIVTGSIQSWSTAPECPNGPAIDNMLAFRVTAAGAVTWSHRYNVAGPSFDLSGVDIKAATAFAYIAANGSNEINGVVSPNIAYFKLQAGSGALAQQTELFGGDATEQAAEIIPLGPVYPLPALILGTTDSFANIFHSNPKPYLIERMPSARQRCADREVGTQIVPTPLPPHELIVEPIALPMLTQPLVLISHTVSDWLICENTIVGDLNGDGGVTVGDIAGFVLALTDPAGYQAAFPDGDIEAADTNGDGVVSVGDISDFVQLLTQGGG